MTTNKRHQDHYEPVVDNAASVADTLHQIQLFGVEVFAEATKANPNYVFSQLAVLETEIRNLAGHVRVQARQMDSMQDVVDLLTKG